MKRLILALNLAAAPMIAAAAEPPKTIELPAPLVGQLVQYLAGHTYREVASMPDEIHACWEQQVPNEQGVMVGHGGCPVGKMGRPPASAHSADAAKLSSQGTP